MAAVSFNPSTPFTLPLEEARRFLGKRYELYKLVKENVQPVEVLEAHTALMVENRNTLKGFLWKVLDKSSGRTVHLIGTVHSRINLSGVDYPDTLSQYLPFDESLKEVLQAKEKWLQRIIHPEIEKCVLESHQVYLEADTQSFEYIDLLMPRLNKFYEAHPELSNSTTKPAEYPFVQQVFEQIQRLGLDEALFSFLEHREKIKFLEPFETHIRSCERSLQVVCDDPGHSMLSPESQLQDVDAGQWGNFEMFEARYDDYPQAMREDWEERTELHIAQIKKSLQEGSQDVFAVGIGHYCGARSILAALPPADYEVTRIALD